MKLERILALGTLGIGLAFNSCSNDNGPTSPDNNGETDVIEGSTNEYGQTIFYDDTLTFVNEDNEPIPNLTVSLTTGTNYNALSAEDSSGTYLPYQRFSTNLESDTLTLESEFRIKQFNGDETSALYYFLQDRLTEGSLNSASDPKARFTDDLNCEYYLGTIDGETSGFAYQMVGGIFTFLFGDDFVWEFAGDFFANLQGYESMEDMLMNNNHDMYDLQWGVGGSFSFISNQPTLNIDSFEVGETEVNLSWSGTDETTYPFDPENEGNYFEDHTIPCRGPTQNSDFNLEYSLLRGSDLVLSGETTNTQLSLTDLEPGAYTLDLTLFDDTQFPYGDQGWQSSGINTNQTGLDFLISSGEPSEIEFTEHQIWTERGGFSNLQTTDINNDGYMDILAIDWPSSSTSGVIWMENNQGNSFTEHRLADLERAIGLGHADLDGDGDTDITTTCMPGFTRYLAWFENTNENQFTEHTITNENQSPMPWELLCSNVDGDGDQDIIGSPYSPTRLIWYENIDNNFIETPITNRFHQTLQSTDIDNDGDQDIIGADPLYWYEYSEGSFLEHLINAEANLIHISDLEGDGDQDILCTSHNEEKNGIYCFRNDATIFTEVEIWNRGGQIHSGDLDLDGDQDIILAKNNTDSLSWLQNNGESFTEYPITTKPCFSYRLHAEDLDNDGDIDIIIANFFPSEPALLWYENNLIP